MTLKDLFKQNRYYFLSYIVLVVFGMFILLSYTKAAGFILMNPFHPALLDYFFIPLTWLGDGIFVVSFAILLFLIKKRALALLIFASYLLSGLFVRIAKPFFDRPRPSLYLENSDYPYFLDSIDLHKYYSFPSGHTATIFALVTVLVFSFKNKNYSIILLLVAALVGYSRIYLGQHFLEDVLAGSVLGVVSAVLCEVFLNRVITGLLGIKKISKNIPE